MPPLLASGVELMLIGMGTVFLFLTILVLATHVMSRTIARFAPVPPPRRSSVLGDSDEEVAAISAAISEHRRRGG